MAAITKGASGALDVASGCDVTADIARVRGNVALAESAIVNERNGRVIASNASGASGSIVAEALGEAAVCSSFVAVVSFAKDAV